MTRLLITVLARNFRPREIIRKFSSIRRDGTCLYTYHTYLPIYTILLRKSILVRY